MILISLPVHEKVEVVLDQIANIRKFAPQAYVVIHPARQFAETSNVVDRLRNLEGVWVNPQPLYTGFGMVLKCHISNFIFARDAGISFTHFCLHSSNDLFVRPGVEAYVSRHDFGFFKFEVGKGPDLFTHWISDFHKDRVYRKMMLTTGKPPTSYASQVEGTFYPAKAFEEFAKCYLRFAWDEFYFLPGYAHGSHHGLVLLLDKLSATTKRRVYTGKYAYPREEFYLPNFFSTMYASPAPPYCLMDWEKHLKVTIQDVKTIRDGGIPMACYKELFSVKRVNRDIDDPLRTLIRLLDTEPRSNEPAGHRQER